MEHKWNTGHPTPVWTANIHDSAVYRKWEMKISQKISVKSNKKNISVAMLKFHVALPCISTMNNDLNDGVSLLAYKN